VDVVGGGDVGAFHQFQSRIGFQVVAGSGIPLCRFHDTGPMVAAQHDGVGRAPVVGRAAQGGGAGAVGEAGHSGGGHAGQVHQVHEYRIDVGRQGGEARAER